MSYLGQGSQGLLALREEPIEKFGSQAMAEPFEVFAHRDSGAVRVSAASDGRIDVAASE